MADWVTGKVTKVQNWTDALFSLTVHAPVLTSFIYQRKYRLGTLDIV